MQMCFLFVLLNCNTANASYSKPDIIVSITPVASLVSMLTDNKANISVLDSAAGCPHEHYLKPSHKTKINKSDMLIYIDDDFDEVAAVFAQNYNGTKVKISDFDDIDFSGTNGFINWHFWLDLNNVKIMHNKLAVILAQRFPELEKEIKKNLIKSSKKIDDLNKFKRVFLSNIDFIVLIGDSAEHFFKSLYIKNLKTFPFSNISLKNINKLDSTLKSDDIRCIVLSYDQDDDSYKKYHKKIIKINSENWSLEKNEKVTSEIFVNKYLEMINELKKCEKISNNSVNSI